MGTQSNPMAIGLFLAVVAATLAITWLTARGARSRNTFYNAGGDISAFRNGLAIAGDYMSAAAFLGVSGLITTSGFDGMLYGVGFVMGWPIVLFLVAERLRKLGKFNFACALAHRLRERPMRIFAACSSLTVIAFYLIAQMVGAGQLIQLLFGIDYTYAVVLVGVLMTCYVMFGGMLATTWIQIVKATLLLGSAAILTVLTLARFGFDLSALVDRAVAVHPRHEAILAPVGIGKDPVSGFSLGLALLLGTAGLPHVLMRFFTVHDVRAARGSVFFACLFNAVFFLMVYVIGFGAVALVLSDPVYQVAGGMRGGANMAAINLSQIVGGDALMGLVAAVAFATILAVVSGLTLAGASAVSHDLYARALGVSDDRKELLVGRCATVVIGVAAILLGLGFRTQNVAYMVSLAFAIAASANFPVLLLSMTWRGLTTAGALAGGIVGLVSALALTVLGPAIWLKTLGFPAPIFPYDPPALFTVPLAFITAWGVSVWQTRGDRYALAPAA
ncbi:sodium/solute symporter (plasmid) [Methylobacterium sp. NMS12]|uniref:sodium:solute symporter family transporter n=1 Tax=Methylobacterium sp. NMS12 TaxID=3079766 RepID=UPI003F880EA4